MPYKPEKHLKDSNTFNRSIFARTKILHFARIHFAKLTSPRNFAWTCFQESYILTNIYYTLLYENRSLFFYSGIISTINFEKLLISNVKPKPLRRYGLWRTLSPVDAS